MSVEDMKVSGTTAQPDQTRAGFAALIGAPNAGKSTLMNAMVGQKVSIVTPKVQTTRSRIRGIAMQSEAQITDQMSAAPAACTRMQV